MSQLPRTFTCTDTSTGTARLRGGAAIGWRQPHSTLYGGWRKGRAEAVAAALASGPSLGDLLTARPTGLIEPESWAILCQAVQALQDLFLSDGASGDACLPLVTPSSLLLSPRGRVKLSQNKKGALKCGPSAHLATGYLAPEYRASKHYTDTEVEKMWIYSLGETLKRATLTSHAATTRLSAELCQVLTDMTRLQASTRASLMHLLDIISQYCTRRQQNRPFSHIVMDLHQEAMAAVELSLETLWAPPAMPQLQPRTWHRPELSCNNAPKTFGTIPRRWIGLTRKYTKEASTSMEDLSCSTVGDGAPGRVVRPKSMCVPPSDRYFEDIKEMQPPSFPPPLPSIERLAELPALSVNRLQSAGAADNANNKSRLKVRRNPVQRVASKLNRHGNQNNSNSNFNSNNNRRNSCGQCLGPEFVVRAGLPHKKITLPDSKGHSKKTVTVVMLNGQKLDIGCNPNVTTAGQLFETIIQNEHIEENFMLGLSALIAGDFVFLPSDTRICKAFSSNGNQNGPLTLFMRVRFFLPTLRGIRSGQARHLLYLQLRRSILEHQLPCSFTQLIELNGLALQAEFGDFTEREHTTRNYFLLEHYVPETMSCAIENPQRLRQELMKAHRSKKGLDADNAEEDFILVAQQLPHYGGHFYTATWKILKENRDVWLYISAQGINLYERAGKSNKGPQLYESFEWRSIQTLCYSKQYLCILPHANKVQSKLKKYKLKLDNKKSYFTFRLASLHHQFFLRLRTEYTSLQSLSYQFGIPLKDIKNESNSLQKLESLTNHDYMTIDQATVNAAPEFKIDFRSSSRQNQQQQQPEESEMKCRRSKSANDFALLKDEPPFQQQDMENENPSAQGHNKAEPGLVLDSGYLSGLPSSFMMMMNNTYDKRSGVKMGTKAYGPRVSRSMETVNDLNLNHLTNDNYLEEMSLQSVSLHCSSTSVSRSPELGPSNEAYILLDSTIKSNNNQLLPDFQETLSDSLLDKINTMSFAEERMLLTVEVERDSKNSLGLQITEGSDGNVYVQSVILGGPAHLTGKILSGDQVIAVDGQSLLGMKYNDALNLLKNRGRKVEFILSRIMPKVPCHNLHPLRLNDELKGRKNLSQINESHLKSAQESIENSFNKLMHGSSPVEKHLIENCTDALNLNKHMEVPYHKHIRYEIESQSNKNNNNGLNKIVSKSCNNLNRCNDDPKRAVVVGVIPKAQPNIQNWHSLDRKFFKDHIDSKEKSSPQIALPRSLGLSRKWRGPVRYPVTPIKKTTESIDGSDCCFTASDEEQVFI